VDAPSEVVRLFALVREALARATWSLLNDDVDLAQQVVVGDDAVDVEAGAAESRLWEELRTKSAAETRRVVTLLLLVSELERSADLAAHVAERAVDGLGRQMGPVGRGIVQRMFEVASDMWASAAELLADASRPADLHETDEELDILRDRLMKEAATGGTEPSLAGQMTLLARFYERLGDHAVNISRRLADSWEPGS
jgi:phosphate transport system protein